MFEKELRDVIQLSVQDAADRFEKVLPAMSREELVNHLHAGIVQSLYGMSEISFFEMSGAFSRDLHITYYSEVR